MGLAISFRSELNHCGYATQSLSLTLLGNALREQTEHARWCARSWRSGSISQLFLGHSELDIL